MLGTWSSVSLSVPFSGSGSQRDQSHLESLLSGRAGPHPQRFWSSRCGEEEIMNLHKFQGDTDAAGL